MDAPKFLFSFLLITLILCSSEGHKLRWSRKQVATQHDSLNFPSTTPAIVTIPSATPVTVTPTPATTPVTFPPTITTPAAPATNPVTTPTANTPPAAIPVTTPPVAPPAATTAPGQSWCVVKSGAAEKSIQAALDYACGIGGADCATIQRGASCYNPNTLQNHASYAFNSYYQRNPVPTSCDFGGTAVITNANPSSGSCVFATSATTASPTLTPPTTASPNLTPPTTASPNLTPPTTASPNLTPPTTASPNLTPPTAASPIQTPPTAASPTLTPPTTASPTLTPPTTASPTLTPPTTASPNLTPPTTASPMLTPPTTVSPVTKNPTQTPIPTPSTAPSTGASPMPMGFGTPPTTLNGSNPDLGLGGGSMGGFGDGSPSPVANMTSSESATSSLRPLLSCILLVASIVNLDMHM